MATRRGRPSLTVGNAVLSLEEGKDSRTRSGGSGSGHPSGTVEKPRLRPASTQAQKPTSRPASSPLRRRTKPLWQPPQRPRAPFTPLADFVSRNLLRPSARSALLFLPFPHPESQVPRAGTLPLLRFPSPDPPLLCPPSLFGSRSRKEPKCRRKKSKLSPVSEAFPKRWRKEPKFSERGGGCSWHLRKEPKFGNELNLWLGLRASSGSLRKVTKSGTVRLVGSSRLLGQGRRRRAGRICASKDWDNFNFRKEPNS